MTKAIKQKVAGCNLQSTWQRMTAEAQASKSTPSKCLNDAIELTKIEPKKSDKSLIDNN